MLVTRQKVLRRFWYAIMPMAQLDAGPQPFTLLGEPIVLWKGAGGKPHALRDRCCHRTAKLSKGFVDSDGNFAGSRVQNAASAHVKGVEPELTLFFGKSLTINGYYSYSKGKYIKYLSANSAGGFDDLSPSPFAGAPINNAFEIKQILCVLD